MLEKNKKEHRERGRQGFEKKDKGIRKQAEQNTLVQ